MKNAPAMALSLGLAAWSATATRAGPAADAGNPVAAIALESLAATRDRPLFSPTRRPPPVAAAPVASGEAAPPPPPSPTLSLLGTAIDAKDRVAVIARGAEPPDSLREGEGAWGWTLRAVGPRSATLEGFGRTITLELSSAPPPPAPAADDQPPSAVTP